MSPVSLPSRLPGSHLLTRRNFLLGATAAGAGLLAYSGTHGRHELEVTEVTLPIRNLPESFQGFRFAQISDLHLVEYTEPWFLEEVVRRTNALQAELVLITGDFVSRGPESDRVAWRAAGAAAEILSTLTAPQRYGILGNHDVAVGASHVAEPLRAHGTPLLIDSYIPIERGYDRLWLCGSDDAESGAPDMDLTVPKDPRAPCLLMVHEPDYVERLRHHPQFGSVDVMLSGHSHGGQIRLPGIGPLILPPMGKRYVEGLFQIEHMKLYVNRGIGTVGLPLRLNCPAEITHFTLVRA